MRCQLFVALIVCASLLGVAQTKIVYETGFENDGELPPGWAIESHGPGPDWEVGGNQNNRFMRVRFGPGGEQDEWLVSPSLDLTEEQGIKLVFQNYFSTVGEGVAQVRLSLDGGGSWETLIEFDENAADQNQEVLVPQADGQPDVAFCWRYLAYGDDKWEIDNVRLFSEVPVDMSITGVYGPSSGDCLRRGSDIMVRLVVENLGSESSPGSTIHFATGQGSAHETLMGGLPAGESLAVTFTVPGSLFAAPGDEALSVVVETDGDGVASNDSLIVDPLHVMDIFAQPARLLLNFDSPADSTLFAGVLEARGIPFDSWNRRSGGGESNLYGLDAWQVVCFTETEIYPALPEQYALMRFLDSASGSTKRSLLISGDEWLRYYHTFGSVLAEFVEAYLRLTGGEEFSDQNPDLYPFSGNALGIDRTISTSAPRPDILAPHSDYPGAEVCMSYDQDFEFGALAAVRQSYYSAVVTGFEWGQLITVDDQQYLAGVCIDWLFAAGADAPTGQMRPEYHLAPNPSQGRMFLRVPEHGAEGPFEATLVDLAGRRTARWTGDGAEVVALDIPQGVSSGVYCLIMDADRERWSGTVILQR